MKKIMLLLCFSLIPTACALAQDKSWEIRPQSHDFSRPFNQAGSTSNPWQARERYDGSIEVRSQQHDFSQPFNSPGQPSNPWIVKPVK